MRVRELERTKSRDVVVDYFQEMKDNERRIIERRKLLLRKQRELMMQSSGGHVGGNHRDNAGGVNDNMMYDPILDDLKSAKLKESRQGDDASGLDAGLEALEGISFGFVFKD